MLYTQLSIVFFKFKTSKYSNITTTVYKLYIYIKTLGNLGHYLNIIKVNRYLIVTERFFNWFQR